MLQPPLKQDGAASPSEPLDALPQHTDTRRSTSPLPHCSQTMLSASRYGTSASKAAPQL